MVLDFMIKSGIFCVTLSGTHCTCTRLHFLMQYASPFSQGYFSGTSQYQFIAETYIVLVLCILYFCVHKVPKYNVCVKDNLATADPFETVQMVLKLSKPLSSSQTALKPLEWGKVVLVPLS